MSEETFPENLGNGGGENDSPKTTGTGAGEGTADYFDAAAQMGTETDVAVAIAEEDEREPGSPEGLGKLSVQPFITNSVNMGLEKYKYVVYPGTFQTESITCIQDGELIRYVNGLNEMAPEIQGIRDKEKKKAAILDIRTKVAYLENRLKGNNLDVNDKDFWSKVLLLKPDNVKFWESITLDLGNDKIHLDPAKNPKDYIILLAIEAGGFSLIAKSWEDARSLAKPPKWYLDYEAITVKTRTEGKKLRNKALGLLDDLFGENVSKLMLVAKVTDAYGHQYNYKTPPDVLYENMDMWINGESGDKNMVRAAKSFIDNAELSPKELRLKALCRDAAFYKILAAKPDGQIYHMDTNIPVGRNMEEAQQFFGNPVNEELLGKLMEVVEGYWKE